MCESLDYEERLRYQRIYVLIPECLFFPLFLPQLASVKLN